MEQTVYDISGSKVKEISLDSTIFGVEGKDQAIYDKMKNELANRRLGTASVKTRGMVRGGGKKPWRQKGTGRARAGSNTSPLWPGGGVVFGPQPRDYSYTMPKKIRRLAIVATLSKKFAQGLVSIVQDFTVESGKTKDAVKILQSFNKNDDKRVLLIHNDDDVMLKRSIRNISWLRFMCSKRLMVHEMFYARHIVIMEGALANIQETYKVGR